MLWNSSFNMGITTFVHAKYSKAIQTVLRITILNEFLTNFTDGVWSISDLFDMSNWIRIEDVRTTSMENESTLILGKNKNTIWDVEIKQI